MIAIFTEGKQFPRDGGAEAQDAIFIEWWKRTLGWKSEHEALEAKRAQGNRPNIIVPGR